MSSEILTILLYLGAIACFLCVAITFYSICVDFKKGYIDLGKNFEVAYWQYRKLLFIRYLVLKVSVLCIGCIYGVYCLDQLSLINVLKNI